MERVPSSKAVSSGQQLAFWCHHGRIPVGWQTGLARQAHNPQKTPLDHDIKICIRKDDTMAFPVQLQRNTFEVTLQSCWATFLPTRTLLVKGDIWSISMCAAKRAPVSPSPEMRFMTPAPLQLMRTLGLVDLTQCFRRFLIRKPSRAFSDLALGGCVKPTIPLGPC